MYFLMRETNSLNLKNVIKSLLFIYSQRKIEKREIDQRIGHFNTIMEGLT